MNSCLLQLAFQGKPGRSQIAESSALGPRAVRAAETETSVEWWEQQVGAGGDAGQSSAGKAGTAGGTERRMSRAKQRPWGGPEGYVRPGWLERKEQGEGLGCALVGSTRPTVPQGW